MRGHALRQSDMAQAVGCAVLESCQVSWLEVIRLYRSYITVEKGEEVTG